MNVPRHSTLMMNIAVYCKCEESYCTIAIFVQGSGEESKSRGKVFHIQAELLIFGVFDGDVSMVMVSL